MRENIMNIKEILQNKKFQKPLMILGFSVIAVIAEVIRELNGFCVRRYEVTSDKIQNEMKILFLSDLHGKVYGESNERLFRAVEKENADLILVGGDMLTRSKDETDAVAVEFLKRLAEIKPVYIANGNHEQKMRENPDVYGNRYENYKAELEEAGIIYLENESEELYIKGNVIKITGLELPVKCYTHFKNVPLQVEEMEERVDSANASVYQILMAHTPVYAKEYKEWGADLSLSGHLHGGIIRLPFIGGIITPQVKFFPKYSGDMYKDGSHYSVVSRGLGTHTVNLRYLNMAELVSIVMKPEDPSLS
jgi:predicted MPP superfamily phosphohydrolase